MDLLDVSRTVCQDLKHHVLRYSGLSWASSASGGMRVGGLEQDSKACYYYATHIVAIFVMKMPQLEKSEEMLRCREVYL